MVAALGLPTLALMAALGAEGPTPSRLSPDQFNLLAERLAHGESFKVRIQAALILGAGGGPPAEPILREVLRDDTAPAVRAAAALALAELDGVRAVVPLVEALADDDAFVRSQADKALSGLASRDGAELAAPLAAALTAAPEIAKPVGLRVLGGLGDPGADGVVGLLGDPSGSVRSAARNELAVLPAAQVNRALERGLKSGNFSIRSVAAQLAGERGDTEALPELADAVADATEVPEVQEAAHHALQSLKGAIDERVEADQLRHAAEPQARIRALVLLTAKAGAAAEPACAEAVRDPSSLVQAYAVEALGELGDRRALATLHEMLGREELAPLDAVIMAAIHRIERNSPAVAGSNP
jgi:bilin biosynthesis protein